MGATQIRRSIFTDAFSTEIPIFPQLSMPCIMGHFRLFWPVLGPFDISAAAAAGSPARRWRDHRAAVRQVRLHSEARLRHRPAGEADPPTRTACPYPMGAVARSAATNVALRRPSL